MVLGPQGPGRVGRRQAQRTHNRLIVGFLLRRMSGCVRAILKFNQRISTPAAPQLALKLQVAPDPLN